MGAHVGLGHPVCELVTLECFGGELTGPAIDFSGSEEVGIEKNLELQNVIHRFRCGGQGIRNDGARRNDCQSPKGDQKREPFFHAESECWERTNRAKSQKFYKLSDKEKPLGVHYCKCE